MKVYFSDYWPPIQKSKISLYLTNEDVEAYRKADKTTMTSEVQQLLDTIIKEIDKGKLETKNE
jgi:hypothetical protein